MSSSSSITTSTVNGVTRVTGLASGIDVDGIVEQLVAAQKEKKLNKLEQKLQTAEWQQDAYRSIISDITDFEDTYFSTTGSSSIMKASNFLQYTATSGDAAVTVTASSTASAGSHTVSVSQLATTASYSSGSSISKEVQGSATPDYSSLTDESFVLTLDGTDYTVDLDGVTDLDSLQDAIDEAVGSSTKVTVDTLKNSDGTDTGYLTITAQADSGVQNITISAASSSDDGLDELFGTDPVLSNRLSTSSTLETISEQLNTALTFTSDGEFSITINGTTESFDKDTTLATLISTINGADLGATMAYNSLTGELTLTADDTGAGNTLTVADSGTGNFVSTLLTDYTAGTDAVITIDGTKMTRSTNSVTVDGVTYTVNALTTTSTATTDVDGNTVTSTTDDPATVTVAQDTDAIYELVENFVDAYNELLTTISDTIDENADSDYPPLTDDEKDEMTDDEITAWEAKAKVGILENDSTLEDLLSDLRSALTDSVSGLSTTLAGIGITTSSDYTDNGTLEIDADTLTSAIQSDPEAIMNLFTQKATSKATTSSVSGKSLGNNSILYSINATDLSTRYKEEGLAYRFFDILEQNVSTSTFSSGSKGALLAIAGIESDRSDTDNTLTTLIDKYEDEISDEEDRIDEYEEKMYSKYTTLETYINTMNSQLSALSSLTSS